MSSGQRGQTLVELMVAMTVGLLVCAAAFGLVMITANSSGETLARVDATQQARITAGTMVRELRGAVCPAGLVDAIPAARATSVTFYADLDADPVFDPTQWRLSTATVGGRTSIVEERWTQTPPVLASAPPATTRTLVSGIVPPTTRPVFAYWGPNAGGTGLDALAPQSDGALSSADRGRISRIDLFFATRPEPSSRRVVTMPLEASAAARAGRDGQSGSIPTFGC